MDDKIKSKKYRGLSISSMIISFLPFSYAFLLFYFVFYYSVSWSSIRDNFSSELTMMGVSVFKIVPVIAGLAITAIACGSIDLKRIRAGIYSRKGKGLDITGIALGGLSIFSMVIWFVLALL